MSEKKTSARGAKPAKKKSSSGMSKSELVRELAEKAGVTKDQATAMLDGLEAIIKREVKGAAGVIKVAPMFKVAKVHRKAREGRNPATGEKIQIAAKTVVKISLLKGLKDAL